jgi:uncharacterized membrane protein YwzB
LCTPVPVEEKSSNDALIGLGVVGLVVGAFLALRKGGGKGGFAFGGVASAVLPLVVPAIVAVVVWFALQNIDLPLLGKPFAGIAPLAGVVVGLLVFLIQSGGASSLVFGGRRSG